MPKEIKVYEADLTDFKSDPSNANLGTERGADMLRKSIEEVGAGRSLVADKNNLLPAGNKTQEAAVDLGIQRAIVVETEGDALIIHKRTDWDLTDEDPNNPARRYGYWDNRTSEAGLAWSPEQIQLDLASGVDLSAMFQNWELPIGGEGDDPNELWQGMPEFEQEDLGPVRSIQVHFASLEDVAKFAELVGQKITDKTKWIWYPEQEKGNTELTTCRDES